MISVIEKYLLRENNIVFIWLTPGNGELEEQSKANLEDKCPQLSSKTVSEVLSSGFLPGDTVFINWEKVVKKGNKAITDYERKNLHDRIAEAHRSGLRFVIIIDEEHSNDTSKAQNIIESFAAIKQIRMSATAKLRSGSEYYEIEEKEVIKAGIITKAIVINEGIKNYKIKDLSEYEVLIDLALEKRSEVRNNYNLINKKINPLVVIQFPSSSDALIVSVEEYLMGRDITHPLNMTQGRNMATLLSRVNWLLGTLGIKAKVSSGYRPTAINRSVGGAQDSAHSSCEAVDLIGVQLARDLARNPLLLEEADLYLEHPDYTAGKSTGWTHLQSRKPRSGNRILIP
jgi:type III restriction enzyme